MTLMTLGEKICKLRTEHNLSQGDLAEKINVSRQSISKWETGASTPDLDKLITLSDLFHVSIDQLVKDGPPVEAPFPRQDDAVAAPKTAAQVGDTQRSIGFILLAVGLLCGVLALPFGAALLFPAAYLLLCGVLCLTAKRYAGLIIGWLTFLPISFYLPRFTSTSMGTIFVPYLYQSGMYIQLIISYVMWAFLALLVHAAVKHTPLKDHTLLVLGWIVFSKMRGFLPIVFGGVPYEGAVYLVLSLLSVALLALLLFFTARLILSLIRTRKNAPPPTAL